MSFDTVRFKLRNLSRYEQMGYNLALSEKVTIGGMRYVRRANRYGEIEQDELVKAKLTSGSYEINYFINVLLEEVIFEFSIPKYVYGHNLEHFPKECGNEYHDFLVFIKDFFSYEFKIDVNLNDIEILRLDVCKNYSFLSLENKDAYISHMYDLFMKVFNDSKSINYKNGETVMYKTQDYSFKIYDKGKEFLKHDYKKIKKLYGEKRANELYQKASLILRAELTFRKRKISYDFFGNLSKTQQVSNKFKINFMELKKHRDKIDSILNKIVLRCNRFLEKKIDFVKFCIAMHDLEDEYYMKYMKISINAIISRVEKVSQSKFKLYCTDDFFNFIGDVYKRKIRAYNAIVAPKPIKLDLTKQERLFSFNSAEILQLDENLLSLLLEKFDTIYKGINDFKATKISPLLVLSIYKKHLEEQGVKVAPLKRYLNHKKTMSKTQMLNKQIYSRSSIFSFESQLKKVNEIIRKKNNESSIFTVDLPEKMT